jgi:hypothetical protein
LIPGNPPFARTGATDALGVTKANGIGSIIKFIETDKRWVSEVDVR